MLDSAESVEHRPPHTDAAPGAAEGPPASEPQPIALSGRHLPAISTKAEAASPAVSTKAEAKAAEPLPATEASPPRVTVEGSGFSQSLPRPDALAALRRIAAGRGGGGGVPHSAAAGTIPLASGKVIPEIQQKPHCLACCSAPR